MTKLTLLAVLGLIYIGVIRIAYFIMAAFMILFFGMTTWELLRTAHLPARNHCAGPSQTT